jgi:hypothetical protein
MVSVDRGDSATYMQNVTLTSAPTIFQGGTLTIEGPATFTDSPLNFAGKTLNASNAAFLRQGIWQSEPGSSATLHNVHITSYTQWGYRLSNGALNIANSTFQRDLSPVSMNDKSPPPPCWALRVDASWDSDTTLTSQDTSYDGVSHYMPQSCEPFEGCKCAVRAVSGPISDGSVYTLSPGLTACFSL